MAYVHAEGYAAGELKHGPLALVDETVANITIVLPELYDKSYANLREVKSRGGTIICLGPSEDELLKKESDFFLGLPFSHDSLHSCLLANVANQLLSYYVATTLGRDVDRPRNLAKSVTVE